MDRPVELNWTRNGPAAINAAGRFRKRLLLGGGSPQVGRNSVRNLDSPVGAAEGQLRLLDESRVALAIHHHDLAGAQLVEEDLLGQGVFQVALDRATQRPR